MDDCDCGPYQDRFNCIVDVTALMYRYHQVKFHLQSQFAHIEKIIQARVVSHLDSDVNRTLGDDLGLDLSYLFLLMFFFERGLSGLCIWKMHTAT